MKNIFAITALCIHFISNAQTSVWKVENETGTIYLCGTFHVLRDQDYPLPAEFDIAYKASKKIVIETDVSKMNDPALAQSIMSKAMFKDGKTLKTVLSEQTFNKLSKVCASLGLPLQSLLMLKPSMINVTILGVKMLQLGVKNEGVDMHYYKKAMKHKKEVSFLESVELQIDLLTQGSDGVEEEYILLFLDDLKKIEKETIAMLEDWKSGDDAFMNKKVDKIIKASPEYYEELLKNRNDAWMEKIPAYFEDKEIEMVMVGAMHLHGKDGLLHQLEQKGYTLTQVIAP